MLYDRINAADIAKGLIITALTATSFFFLNNIPLWGELSTATGNASKIAGILFPAFIFFYTLTVPFSITKKLNSGLTSYEISKQIFAKGIILITIGVLLVNTFRVDPLRTGIDRFLWSILLIIAIYLVWNRYPEKENNFFTITGLRLTGLAALVFLFFKFNSGSYENNGSLIAGWWELPGLAGWAFILTSFFYLLARNSILWTSLALLLFIALSFSDYAHLLPFLDSVKPYFGVITTGYIPVISFSGLLAGLLLRRFSVDDKPKTLIAVAATGLIMLAAGLFSLRYTGSETVFGNPAWALLSSGASALFLALIFAADEMSGAVKWMTFIRPAGINMLSVYLISHLMYNIAGYFGIDLNFFRNTGNLAANIAASVAWAATAAAIQYLLQKVSVRLKF